jgi:hypothetical protein
MWELVEKLVPIKIRELLTIIGTVDKQADTTGRGLATFK